MRARIELFRNSPADPSARPACPSKFQRSRECRESGLSKDRNERGKRIGYAFGKSLITYVLLIYVHGLYAITQTQLRDIGNKIWKNESHNSMELLTFWNQNEAFPSLGIGHCIWFPANCIAPYVQTFPALLLLFKKQGVRLPTWLAAATVCPWPTRVSFYAPENKQQLAELRDLLANTIDLQAQFMIDRVRSALPKIIEAAHVDKRCHVKSCFNSIIKAPQGLYALVDYVNFKGDGTNEKERYAGYGWGLLQVLEGMEGTNANPIEAFVLSARAMLERRVTHAVRQDVERRALIGWINRINTYKQ